MPARLIGLRQACTGKSIEFLQSFESDLHPLDTHIGVILGRSGTCNRTRNAMLVISIIHVLLSAFYEDSNE
jgi:hypothetical protein